MHDLGPIRSWIVNHDESWVFTIAYVSLAIVLSIMVSLFWLVAVVAGHLAFEIVRQRHVRPQGPVWRAALWETKLDVALILAAAALAVYLDLIVGAAGLGGAARLGVQTTVRASGWSQAIRGVLLSLDDAVHVVRVFMRGSGGDAAMAPAEAGQSEDREQASTAGEGPPSDEAAQADASAASWTMGDHFAIWLGVACLALVVLAPLWTPLDAAALIELLGREFHPVPQ